MNPTQKIFSITIPARNEETQITRTVNAVLAAVAHYEKTSLETLDLHTSRCEVIIVDNQSSDRTAARARACGRGVQVIGCERLKAPCARNRGARRAGGDILVFVDADTLIPENSLGRIEAHVRAGHYAAGIFAYASREPGLRACLWWRFWNCVRRLPIARAKAMPAFMFCTRETFDRFGPFDEQVVIGEEWPILAGLYHADPGALVYDRRLVARSSSRRMAAQPFGYLRTYAKYLWAILHMSGRIHYTDKIRPKCEEPE